MTLEIKFIILTLFISISQIPLLILLGIFRKYSEPRKRFFLVTISSFASIILLKYFYFNISLKILISSLLILLSSTFILFTFWSILIWGFTTSMLVSLGKKKNYQITKKKWIKIYCNNKDLTTFTKDRIQLLYLIRAIKKRNRNINITTNGYIFCFLYNILKKIFV